MKESFVDRRPVRMVQSLPVAAALILYGIAQNRWWATVPVALGLLWAIRRGVRVRDGLGRLLVVAAFCALLGTGLNLAVPLPEAPFPPWLLGSLGGGLAGAAILASISNRNSLAWLLGWLLTTVSVRVDPASGGAWLGLVCLAMVTMATAILGQGDRPRRTFAAWVALGMAVPILSLGGWGLFRALQKSEGPLIMFLGGPLENLFERWRNSGEFRLPDSVYVGGRGSTVLSGRRLMEVSGDHPKYLRAAVYDRFDGIRWFTSATLQESRRSLAVLPKALRPTTMQLEIVANLGGRLPAPGGLRAVRSAMPQVHAGWTLELEGDLRGVAVELDGDVSEILPYESLTEADWLTIPAGLRAELLPLAREIVRAATDSKRRAQLIEKFFQENFSYSTSVDLVGSGHPLGIMVREHRPAYCTYFASAMAALLRSLGTPARVVGGFAVPEANVLTGSAVVRERDAHAWVEAWSEKDERFLAYDPTPWESRERVLGTKPSRWGHWIEAVGMAWDRTWAGFRRSPLAALQRLAFSPFSLLVLVVLALWILRRRLRRPKRATFRDALESENPRLRAIYRRYVRLLRRERKITPDVAETDDELLDRLKAHQDASGGTARQFVELYRVARYRGEVANEELLDRALDELESVLVLSASKASAKRAQ